LPSLLRATSPMPNESVEIACGGDPPAGMSDTVVVSVISVGTSPTRNDGRSPSRAVSTTRHGPPSAGMLRFTGASRFNRTPLGAYAHPGWIVSPEA
jgi:hypothetical protein